MRTLFLASAALALALAGSAAAQVQYNLDVDLNGSPATWDGDTNLGPLNGNKNLNFDGTLGLALGAATAPFGTAAYNGGDILH